MVERKAQSHAKEGTPRVFGGRRKQLQAAGIAAGVTGVLLLEGYNFQAVKNQTSFLNSSSEAQLQDDRTDLLKILSATIKPENNSEIFDNIKRHPDQLSTIHNGDSVEYDFSFEKKNSNSVSLPDLIVRMNPSETMVIFHVNENGKLEKQDSEENIGFSNLEPLFNDIFVAAPDNRVNLSLVTPRENDFIKSLSSPPETKTVALINTAGVVVYENKATTEVVSV